MDDIPSKEIGGLKIHYWQTKLVPAYHPYEQESSHFLVFVLVYFFLSHSAEHVFKP